MTHRKGDTENHVFQHRWELDYMFTEFRRKLQCLACLQTVSALKDFNLSRHYSCSNKAKYDKYTGVARTAIITDLKAKINKQQRFFVKATTTQDSQRILCGFSRTCEIQEGVVRWRDGKVVHHRDGKVCSSLPPDPDKSLDESTDVTDVSQLLIYTRAIDMQLHGTTKRADIFNKVQSVVTEYGGFDKLSAVGTDGAPSMQGRRTGFVGLLQQSGVDCPILRLSVQRHLTSFVSFLDEVDAAYGDLQLHTEVKRMSRGKCLERFFTLRLEIPLFLEDSIASDTRHNGLNLLNLQLQGRGQTVCNLFESDVQSAYLTHFPACTELHNDIPESTFKRFSADISILENQFSKRFQDFQSMSSWIILSNVTPFSTQIEISRIEQHFRNCYLRPASLFALAMGSMFASTYVCESRREKQDGDVFSILLIVFYIFLITDLNSLLDLNVGKSIISNTEKCHLIPLTTLSLSFCWLFEQTHKMTTAPDPTLLPVMLFFKSVEMFFSFSKSPPKLMACSILCWNRVCL
uniref:DUF4371 domain-containing protein n=1 Tax=Labrus bergylta TaxID=56723 RepID=A0A3Q3L324_9LABR